ncbi:hypothetical protein RvY_05726 [Ramazzottius varieornatus]|uniref:Uncharacterized protein n=1 Tax=Ramazzottius varieornatus TaxID=947166 RepID=A0A1D1UZN0_RAMVA|nr:hypothetical protein RvY_05726 [Ramazzottius varieornatus]
MDSSCYKCDRQRATQSSSRGKGRGGFPTKITHSANPCSRIQHVRCFRSGPSSTGNRLNPLFQREASIRSGYFSSSASFLPVIPITQYSFYTGLAHVRRAN